MRKKYTLGLLVLPLAVLIGLLVVVFATTLVMFNSKFMPNMTIFLRALIAAGITALLVMPIFIWIYIKSLSLGNYSSFALEEMEIDSDDLSEAVSNWIYLKYRIAMEDGVQILEDENKNIVCRVNVRKKDY